MMNVHIRVLAILRMFGPCSNAEVARKLELSLDATYRAICWLTKEGYAEHPKKQVWQITQKGLEWFDSQPAKPLKIAE